MNKPIIIEDWRRVRWLGAMVFGLGIGSLLGLITNLLRAPWHASISAGLIVSAGLLIVLAMNWKEASRILTVLMKKELTERFLTLVLGITLGSVIAGLILLGLRFIVARVMPQYPDMGITIIFAVMAWGFRIYWALSTLFLLAAGVVGYLEPVEKPGEAK